ncbi:MAG: SMC-Scp complex subunit ScpB [Clostridia bacterium]|nr:SMC-Scp complex subunit ScpB [Clostridia bacterium]
MEETLDRENMIPDDNTEEPAEAELDKAAFFGAVESMLYVSGEPIGFAELVRVFDLTEQQVRGLLFEMELTMRADGRGVIPFLTDSTVQLVTNPRYYDKVVSLLSPPEERSLSDSMMETLSVIAYRQPVTRADIEAVRGVRCEYSVTQLLKQGLIRELGRKDCIGRPMLFGTTDAFLRKFGLHSLDELPPMPVSEEEPSEDIEVV